MSAPDSSTPAPEADLAAANPANQAGQSSSAPADASRDVHTQTLSQPQEETEEEPAAQESPVRNPGAGPSTEQTATSVPVAALPAARRKPAVPHRIPGSTSAAPTPATEAGESSETSDEQEESPEAGPVAEPESQMPASYQSTRMNATPLEQVESSENSDDQQLESSEASDEQKESPETSHDQVESPEAGPAVEAERQIPALYRSVRMNAIPHQHVESPETSDDLQVESPGASREQVESPRAGPAIELSARDIRVLHRAERREEMLRERDTSSGVGPSKAKRSKN